MPRLTALEQCGPDRCEYVAWALITPGGVLTVAFAGPPHNANWWPSLEAALEHFEAHVDEDPVRHIGGTDG